MNIRYLKHTAIDKNRWDACINAAPNGLVYGMSWYLDVVCPGWDALVADDYSAVMPLPWKQKLGIKYIYHPLFAQQLGVFYQCEANDQSNNFLAHIPLKFMKLEVSLNYLNHVKLLSLNIRTNLLLPLNKPYNELLKSCNENTRRNIKKAIKLNPLITDKVELNDFIALKRETLVASLKKAETERLYTLITYLVTNNHAKIVGVYSDTNQLLAAVCLVHFKNRLVYLFAASSEQGKEQRSMFAVINYIMQQNALSDTLIDFEGSNIEGVAQFFKGFGAVTENYYRYKKSRIPLIKR
jgi:lipid II:glycine glycyltransferase (peptidoglycan interpeptide bridge formation enzyme)